jgi:F0F1-type ATP synthase membrane subunit b/b'
MEQVQALIEAEREAQEIVQGARAERDQIMRRADETARAEIQQYSESREAKLRHLENAVQMEVDQATADLEKQTVQRTQAFQERLISRQTEPNRQHTCRNDKRSRIKNRHA